MAIDPAWFAPDLYWEDLSIGAQWRTQARTITVRSSSPTTRCA